MIPVRLALGTALFVLDCYFFYCAMKGAPIVYNEFKEWKEKHHAQKTLRKANKSGTRSIHARVAKKKSRKRSALRRKTPTQK